MTAVSHHTANMSALGGQWTGHHTRAYLDLAALALPTSLPRLCVRAASSTGHVEEEKRESPDRHVIDTARAGREENHTIWGQSNAKLLT